MSEPTTPSGRDALSYLSPSWSKSTQWEDSIAAIEREARAALLDELEAAVRRLAGVTTTTYGANGLGTVASAHKVFRADVLALIQQHREGST